MYIIRIGGFVQNDISLFIECIDQVIQNRLRDFHNYSMSIFKKTDFFSVKLIDEFRIKNSVEKEMVLFYFNQMLLFLL